MPPTTIEAQKDFSPPALSFEFQQHKAPGTMRLRAQICLKAVSYHSSIRFSAANRAAVRRDLPRFTEPPKQYQLRARIARPQTADKARKRKNAY